MDTQDSFGQQKKITTPNGGWAIYYEIDERWGGGCRYEVGSKMWSNGGGSIIGYANNQTELDILLAKAERESAYSKRQSEQIEKIPTGYAVTSTGDLVLQADWDEIEGAM